MPNWSMGRAELFITPERLRHFYTHHVGNHKIKVDLKTGDVKEIFRKKLTKEEYADLSPEQKEIEDKLIFTLTGYLKPTAGRPDVHARCSLTGLTRVSENHYRIEEVEGAWSCFDLANAFHAYAAAFPDFKFALSADEGGQGFVESYHNLGEHPFEFSVDYDEMYSLAGYTPYYDTEYDEEDEDDLEAAHYEKNTEIINAFFDGFDMTVSAFVGFDINKSGERKMPPKYKLQDLIDAGLIKATTIDE